MSFTTRIEGVLLGWNFLPSKHAFAGQAPMLVNPTIRFGLAATVVVMLLFAMCMGVIQFSRDGPALRRARLVSGWLFAFAALTGSLIANNL
jgi:hypothetical protein